MTARKRRQVVTRIRPPDRSVHGEFYAPIPGTQGHTAGVRVEPAPPPEEQLDPGEEEVDEDGLDAVDLMERGGLR